MRITHIQGGPTVEGQVNVETMLRSNTPINKTLSILRDRHVGRIFYFSWPLQIFLDSFHVIFSGTCHMED